MSDDGQDETVEAAKTLSSLGAAKGGRARASRLTPEERSEIARNAVLARWKKAGKEIHERPVLRAICGSADHPLRIGEIEIPCYVVEDPEGGGDGIRVLSQRGLQKGIGISEGGGHRGAPRIAEFMASLDVKGVQTRDLAARLSSPISFVPPHGGNPAEGYEAKILTDICRVILAAALDGKLTPRQMVIAERCAVLQAGYAEVGINALVDEATGYQNVRARDALAKILERFIARELRPYVGTFPPDFYREIYRLKGWRFPSHSNRRTPLIGHITNDLVYSRLAPGVLDELRARNPVTERGYRRDKHFQWLTEDIGHPKLKEHLAAVGSIQRLANDGDYDGFLRMMDRALPRQLDMPLFDPRKNASLMSSRGAD